MCPVVIATSPTKSTKAEKKEPTPRGIPPIQIRGNGLNPRPDHVWEEGVGEEGGGETKSAVTLALEVS